MVFLNVLHVIVTYIRVVKKKSMFYVVLFTIVKNEHNYMFGVVSHVILIISFAVARRLFSR